MVSKRNPLEFINPRSFNATLSRMAEEGLIVMVHEKDTVRYPCIVKKSKVEPENSHLIPKP